MLISKGGQWYAIDIVDTASVTMEVGNVIIDCGHGPLFNFVFSFDFVVLCCSVVENPENLKEGKIAREWRLCCIFLDDPVYLFAFEC